MASSIVAQTQTLTTGLTPNNNGNIGGGLYFDLQINTTITITSLDMWAGSGSTAGTGSWELWLGPSTYVNNVTSPGLWTKVGTTISAPVTGGVYQMLTGLTVTPVPQIAAVTLAPGNYGFAFKSLGNATNGYTNGVICTSTTIPGSCANSVFSTPHLTLRAGAAQNAFLTGGIFSPRIFSGNISYTLGGTPITFAQREPYGAGCYLKARSFYEFWASSTTVDVANTSMHLIYDSVNNRYGPIIAGTTAPIPVVSAPLGHTDDSNVSVALLGSQPIIYPTPLGPGIALNVEMCSNGYVNLNGTNPATGAGVNPAVPAFLSGTPRIGYWHDFDPSGLSYTPAATGCSTNYDYDAVSQSHVFTWFNCPDSFRTIGTAANRSTFQLAFFANGDVEFRWGALVLGGGQWPSLIGFTNGGNAVDPGNRDLTASFPFFTDNADQAALHLEGDVNPVLNTTVNLTTSNGTGVNVGVLFVCLADLPPFSPTGLDLGIIGAPGCVANVDINQGVGTLITNIGPPLPGMTVAFPIPAGPLTIVGLSFYCQTAWLDATQNPGGIITSNALRLRVGSF